MVTSLGSAMAALRDSATGWCPLHAPFSKLETPVSVGREGCARKQLQALPVQVPSRFLGRPPTLASLPAQPFPPMPLLPGPSMTHPRSTSTSSLSAGGSSLGSLKALLRAHGPGLGGWGAASAESRVSGGLLGLLAWPWSELSPVQMVSRP